MRDWHAASAPTTGPGDSPGHHDLTRLRTAFTTGNPGRRLTWQDYFHLRISNSAVSWLNTRLPGIN